VDSKISEVCNQKGGIMGTEQHFFAPMARQPWAMQREKLDGLTATLKAYGAGIEIPRRAEQPPARTTNKLVAVVPIIGITVQRADWITKLFGGTSTESIAADIRTLIQDPQVTAIVLNIDSPGGAVYGTPELAQAIFESRGKKPIVAVANSVAASAAYWIASAASELVVTPGGEVGSIGVYALHLDISAAESAAGIKTTLIKAGRLKTAGNPHEPLSEEAQNYLQRAVDRYYAIFTADVAKFRGVTVNEVRSGFGEGGMVGAQDAVKLGMADRVATLDETVARLVTSNGRTSAMGAADQRRRNFYRSENFTDKLSAADEARRAIYNRPSTPTDAEIQRALIRYA
jgi:signal peptide peptidase SppA